MQVRRQFPFHEIEPKWQKKWEDQKAFRAANPGEAGSEKPKYYALDMFPYPSGSGLHVGHLEGYTATDIVSRYKRMKGFNVLHPMGWDAFGLPAEQFAIKEGIHPRITTEKNIANFTRQIKMMGFSYDWSREIDTTKPDYYRWTQWIFLQLFHRGLAYVSEAPVWYCPALGTVLANEEILNTPEGPRSERGNHPVERKPLRQWMLKITAYAERLLQDLELLDWPESLKEMQRNWIGRSEGAEVQFKIASSSETITVYTTRPDTLFGATYMVLAPEHPLVSSLTSSAQKPEVEAYLKSVSSKSDLERTDLAKSKSGVWTGSFAINPVSGDEIPIWIADYVLMGYGTGAIMAVPSHDERDFEFAQQFQLPIREVVRPSGNVRSESSSPSPCFSGDGMAVNSGFISGLMTAEAKSTMIDWLEKNKAGSRSVKYKLRDWLFSRQRYWGEPFPILWKEGKAIPLDEKDLPLILPELDDFKPSDGGHAPLSKAKEWVNTPHGTREINTMPQWAGSCWYYLRYCDPTNSQKLIDPETEKYWLGKQGIDLYIGGAEHAVLHLLYARFWHKVLFDCGVVSSPEPFHKLVNQGIILGENNQKMSKSVGNVVNPDDVLQEYGADSIRLFEMFMGPLEQIKPWATKGVEGVYRFLGRTWRLVLEETQTGDWELSSKITDEAPSESILRRLHETIAKVSEDLDKLAFNTAISQLMILVNDLTKEEKRSRSTLITLLQLLSPFAPHIAEELHEKLGEKSLICQSTWPLADPQYLVKSETEIVIQVLGKVRGKIVIPMDANEEFVKPLALETESIKPWIEGKTIVKTILVPNKLINFVVK